MKIRVVPSDPGWPQHFEQERAAIQAALGDTVDQIHHIGSTAVNGLAAKPILDLMLEVSSLDALDQQTPAMESLGYEALGELGIPGRRYFRKGGDDRSHQVHAFVTGDPHVHRHLAFRDYLRSHPDVADEYATLKQNLALQFPQDLDGYCDGKDAFVKHHEALALG